MAQDDQTARMPRKLWDPIEPKSTAMYQFMQLNYQDLHTWSITSRIAFWEDIWQHTHPLIHSGKPSLITKPNLRMDETPVWFPGVKLNFAENLLYNRSPDHPGEHTTVGKEDGKIAVTAVREGCTEITHVTWGQLRSRVAHLASAMRSHGARKGDRIALVASTSVDTLCVYLAAAALGGIFSSSSTDMGTKGILDRLTQIKPKWVFVDDGAVYNGRTVDLRDKIRDIEKGLEGIREFKGIVTQQRFQNPLDVSSIPRTRTMKEYLEWGLEGEQLRFERIGFTEPYLIVYSSGTTGIPKCIVHSAGGVLLNCIKEAGLHRGMGPDCTVLQYTTTGWIMYMTSVLGLLHGARTVLYDGSPFLPDAKRFVQLLGDEKVTHLGISPRYLSTLQNAGIRPREVTDLSSLRNVTSTGMVLSDALFEWFYDAAFPAHVLLANISGGTDLAGCFALDNPISPLYVGGCQCASLGMDVRVYDQEVEGGRGVKGREVPHGTPGELVCAQPFPNMPVMFWGEKGNDKYFDAYFAKFDNVWTHGDFISIHPQTRQIIFLGRADGVLNPSGVRFGSAEIYSALENTFADRIQDTICVGQRRPQDDDESVMLFVLMKDGKKLDQRLKEEIKTCIREKVGRRCVPKYIFQTWEIPTTVNLKKVELPVKQIVSGKIIKPSGTLLNPDSLKYYYQFAKVEELVDKEPIKSKL